MRDRFVFPALAIVWAIISFSVYGLSLRFWLADWSTSMKLAAFQAAATVAGFGGGFILLWFAADELAKRVARPSIRVEVGDVNELRLRRMGEGYLIGQSDGRDGDDGLALEIINVSDVVPTAWQAAVYCHSPMQFIRTSPEPGITFRLSNHCWTYTSNAPLFGVPIRLPAIYAIVDTQFVEAHRPSEPLRLRVEIIITSDRGISPPIPLALLCIPPDDT